MDQQFNESVAGAAIGLILAVVGNASVASTPLTAAHPQTALAVAGAVTVGLFSLGAVIGILLVRRAARISARSR